MTDDEVALFAQRAFDECTAEMLATQSLPMCSTRTERSFRYSDLRVTSTRGLSGEGQVAGDIEVRLVRLRRTEMTDDQLFTFYERLAGLCMQRLVELRK